MDTKVPLLDGRTLTLTEIANEYKDKELWAYSCDPVTGKFAPGKITWAGVSRPDAEIIRLTLDNGKTIDCTHEHQFPVWGKNLVQAKDLVVGDSMIPLYRKKAQISQANKYGYEQLFDNENKKWVFTHRAVSAWKDANSLENEFVFDPKFIDAEKKTVHHMNCKPLDNSPNNLFRMNNGDHNKWHHANGAIAGSFGGKRAAELGIPQENYAKGRRIL
jgi:DNA gyrase subunit B